MSLADRSGHTVAAPVDCRACGGPLDHVLADLGETPLANGLVTREKLGTSPRYPLRAMVCGRCRLVQLDRDIPPEAMFSDYPYLSSVSSSWLAHAAAFVETILRRLRLGPRSRVVEIASNDGYLLRHFVARGIPCLGVEPAANVAEIASAAGVPTLVGYFGRALATRLAAEDGPADLIVSNNVLAHVPDLHDFVGGISVLLAPGGTWTAEFPHLLSLLSETQFDTIYHEHVFYLSILALVPVLARHGLTPVDVELLPTHGGSVRLYVRHAAAAGVPSDALSVLQADELHAGLDEDHGYSGFQDRVRRIAGDLVAFLDRARSRGRSVAAYGAAAKGATLLDVAGVGSERIDYVCDRNPRKQGLYLPGSRLPIVDPRRLDETRPSFVLVLPWNLWTEIGSELAHIRGWGAKLVRAVPRLEISDPPA